MHRGCHRKDTEGRGGGLICRVMYRTEVRGRPERKNMVVGHVRVQAWKGKLNERPLR